MNLPPFVLRILAVWTGLGTLMMLLGANGVVVPGLSWLMPYFGEAFTEATQIFLGAVVAYLNVIKTIKNSNSGGAEVKSMSTGNKIWYAANPFAL